MIFHKTVLFNILLELIDHGFGINLKIISSELFKKLKNKPNENLIFKIKELDELSNSEQDEVEN